MKLVMKKVLCGVLVAAMLFSMTACSNDKKSGTSEDTNTTTPASEDTGSPAEEATSTPQPAEDLSKQEPVTLEIYAVTFQSAEPASTDSIENAINEYVQPLLNTTVHLNIIPYASYSQQLTLLLSGSEQADLIMGTAPIISNYVAAGGVAQLDEAIAKYGTGIKDALGEDVLNASKINDALFAVPTNRDFASAYGFMYNKNLNDKYGLGLENVKDFAGLDAAFAKLHAQAPDITCIQSSQTSPTFANWDWDSLGSQFGVLMDRGANLTVENLFVTEEYKQIIAQMRAWNLAGYVNKDALTNTIPANDLMEQEKALGYFVNYNPAVTYFSASYKTPMGMSILVEPFSSSTSYLGASWMVSHSTVDVNRAIQFLNLMYSDKTVYNLLTYGVEGQDYIYTDQENGIIDYPEGVTAATSTVDHNNWMWGNEFIGYIWNGDNPEKWVELDAFNKAAYKSKAVGFNFNASNVQNEITACTNVATKYRVGLECGAVDPEEILPQFLAELQQNGIDNIIKEKQTQLDAWAAKNGIE